MRLSIYLDAVIARSKKLNTIHTQPACHNQLLIIYTQKYSTHVNAMLNSYSDVKWMSFCLGSLQARFNRLLIPLIFYIFFL